MTYKQPLLSLTNDFVFKLVLGDPNNSDILADFLSGVIKLSPEDFEDICLVDPHLRREDEHDKLSILDVKVKTKTGKTIDIEIQVCNQTWLRERLVYYLSKMITGQVSSGESYHKIKKAVIIIITDFSFIKDSPRCHNRYQLRDETGTSLLSDVMEINTLELPKARKAGGGMGGGIDPNSKLAEWLTVFNAKSEEELMAVAEKNPKINKVRGILVKLSEDERTRMLAESRQMAEWDREAYILTAQMEGHAKGHALGHAEGHAEGLQEGEERGIQKGIEKGAASVMNLLEAGVPLAEIRQRLGL